MSKLVKRLKKMAVCVYLAAEKTVADDIADGLRKAAARIEELERGQAWRDIASAPKGGALVDLWIKSDRSGATQRCCDCYWWRHGWYIANHGFLAQYHTGYSPTHWRYSPAPPVEPGAGEQPNDGEAREHRGRVLSHTTAPGTPTPGPSRKGSGVGSAGSEEKPATDAHLFGDAHSVLSGPTEEPGPVVPTPPIPDVLAVIPFPELTADQKEYLDRIASVKPDLTQIIGGPGAVHPTRPSSDVLAKVREALRECADDLEAEVKGRYVDASEMVHPALRTRFSRDMEPVYRAREAFALLNREMERR